MVDFARKSQSRPITLIVLSVVSAGLVFLYPVAILLDLAFIALNGYRLTVERNPASRRLLWAGLVVLILALVAAAIAGSAFAAFEDSGSA